MYPGETKSRSIVPRTVRRKELELPEDGLFDEPTVSGEAGDWWPGREGTFVGTLTAFSKGPVFENKDEKTGEMVKSPQVRWEFDVSKLDGTRVQYVPEAGPNEGKSVDACIDGLSSLKISPKSKAGEWFKSLLGRDVNFETETRDALMTEAIGKKALLVLAKSGGKSERIVVKTVARLD